MKCILRGGCGSSFCMRVAWVRCERWCGIAVPAFRWSSGGWSSGAVDAAGPVGVGLPVLDDGHDAAGVGGVYESSVAVADGHVAGVVEEDQLAGLELAQWHAGERGHLLFAGAWEDFAACLEVGV